MYVFMCMVCWMILTPNLTLRNWNKQTEQKTEHVHEHVYAFGIQVCICTHWQWSPRLSCVPRVFPWANRLHSRMKSCHWCWWSQLQKQASLINPISLETCSQLTSSVSSCTHWQWEETHRAITQTDDTHAHQQSSYAWLCVFSHWMQCSNEPEKDLLVRWDGSSCN